MSQLSGNSGKPSWTSHVTQTRQSKILKLHWGLDLDRIHIESYSAWLPGASEFVSPYELFISIGGSQPKLAGREGWGESLPEP